VAWRFGQRQCRWRRDFRCQESLRLQLMVGALPPISYPALLWREGYIFLATTPLELCVHPRSLFQDTVQRARSGEWHIVDADGHYFDVADWTRIKTFGGLNGLALRLFGSVFAAPVLGNEAKLSLPEFKKTLARAVRGRYRYDTDKAAAAETIRKLQAAETHKAAIGAIPKR
jgi:hypothetical protein